MHFSRVKISTTAPLADADAIREALGRAGAGQIGHYDFCSFSVIGKGRFRPGDKANPTIGQSNRIEVVEEEQIEVTCDRQLAKHIISVLRKAHPYEEAIVEITPLIDEDQL